MALQKAHSAFFLYLGVKVLCEVTKEKSVEEVRLKLESLYMTKFLANRLFLKQKLYSFKMVHGRSIEDQIDFFYRLILDLENIKVKDMNEDQALILLSSHPNMYEHLVNSLLYSKEPLTLKDVQVALMSKELKKKRFNEKY